jgi:hypothetical protein
MLHVSFYERPVVSGRILRREITDADDGALDCVSIGSPSTYSMASTVGVVRSSATAGNRTYESAVAEAMFDRLKKRRASLVWLGGSYFPGDQESPGFYSEAREQVLAEDVGPSMTTGLST